MTKAYAPGHVRKKQTMFIGAQKAALKPKRKQKVSISDKNGKPKTLAALLKRAFAKRLNCKKWYAKRRVVVIILKVAV